MKYHNITRKLSSFAEKHVVLLIPCLIAALFTETYYAAVYGVAGAFKSSYSGRKRAVAAATALAMILALVSVVSLTGPMRVSAATGNVTDVTEIRAAGLAGGDIILDNDISISGAVSNAGLQIDNDATIDLNGYTLAIAISGLANGIKIDSTKTLTIKDSSTEQSGVLDITVSGSASNTNYGAGISTTGATLNIESGTVNIKGGNNGACIGGGYTNSGGTVNISGGIVTTSSTDAGAGIGGGGGAGGFGGGGGTVNISGGTVTVTRGAGNGAGIGGGGCSVTTGSGGDGGNITISGGTVAVKWSGGTGGGIGGGSGYLNGGDGGNITITGGTVTSESGGGAAIGGGSGGNRSSGSQGAGGNGGTIKISGGTVNAACKGANGTGIGGGAGGGDGSSGGKGGSGGNITISGGVIVASANPSTSGRGNGIGGGPGGNPTGGTQGGGGDSGTITITGGTVTAIAGGASGESAAIGEGYGGTPGTQGTITIDGGYDYLRNTTNRVTGAAAGCDFFSSDTSFLTDLTYRYIALSPIFGGGDGTPANPYIISSHTQLAVMRELINSEKSPYADAGINYKLNADIDLASYTDWEPIGVYLETPIPFQGVFDGNGFSISNLKVEGYRDYAGLFGYIDKGVVKNLTVKDPVLEISMIDENYIGSIAGYAFGAQIRDVIIENPVITLDSGYGNTFMGGVVGYLDGDSTYKSIAAGIEVFGGSVTITNGFHVEATHNYLGGGDIIGGVAYLGGVAGAGVYSNIGNATVYDTAINVSQGTGSAIEIYQLGVGGIAGYSSAVTSVEPGEAGMCLINDFSSAVIHVDAAITSFHGSGNKIGGICGWVNEDNAINNFYIGSLSMFGVLDAGSYTVSHNYRTNAIGAIVTEYNVNYDPVGTHNYSDMIDVLNDVSAGKGMKIAADAINTDMSYGAFESFHRLKMWETKTILGKANTPFLCHYYPFHGAGTETDPYLIEKNWQLAVLAELVVFGTAPYADAGVYYSLKNDIDISGYCEWNPVPFALGSGWRPIGSNSKPFKGNFDGGGHKISNLSASLPGLGVGEVRFYGLFGVIDGGTVKNLTVSGEVLLTGGQGDIGGLAGRIQNDSVIENCGSGVNIKLTTTSSDKVGGVAGSVIGGSIINNCYATGTVTVTGGMYVGGIAGSLRDSNAGSVTNCAALNPSVEHKAISGETKIGRVLGDNDLTLPNSGTLSNNIAYSKMKAVYGTPLADTAKTLTKGANTGDGADFPVITGDGEIIAGDTLSLTVAAAPLSFLPTASYAWYKAGTPSATSVGTDSPTFTKTAALTDSGDYYCEVTLDGIGTFTTPVKTVAVNTVTEFVSLTADGTADTKETTLLTFTLSPYISSLTISDVTVAGATIKAFTNNAGAECYELDITNITVDEGEVVTVTLSKGGYSFDTASKTVAVHRDTTAPEIVSVTPETGADLSDNIIITFNEAIGTCGKVVIRTGLGAVVDELSPSAINTAGDWIWIFPYSDLDYDTEYGVYISESKDTAGNMIAAYNTTITTISKTAVTNSAKNATDSVTYAGAGFDLSDYFNIDTNAGTPTYTITPGTGAGSVTGKILTVTEAGDFLVKLTTAETKDYAAGAASFILTVTKGTQSAPTGLGAEDASAYGASDGEITNVTTAMEYKEAGAAGYTACAGTTVTGLTAGTYYVRLTETDLREASDYATVTVNQPVQVFDVAWEADGGTPAPTQVTVSYNGSISEPAAMTKTGYTFDGWYSDAALSTKVTFPIANVTADTELYAKWTLNTYDVAWEADGGTPAPTQVTVSYNGSIDEPAAMTKTGYTFDGWYSDAALSTKVTFPIANVTADTELYAKWAEISNPDPQPPNPQPDPDPQPDSNPQPASMPVFNNDNNNTQPQNSDYQNDEDEDYVDDTNTAANSGHVVKDVEKDDFAPKTQLNTDVETLNNIMFDENELERILNGENARIFLVINDISDSVSEETKSLINQTLDSNVLAFYMDISMFKQIGEDDPTKLSVLGDKVSVSIEIPEELRAEGRAFKIIRIHDGEAEIIEGVYDPETGLFTFETDRFSTYTLVYSDADTNNTTVSNPYTAAALGIVPLIISGGIAAVSRKKKRADK